jgi:hypothetical protein
VVVKKGLKKVTNEIAETKVANQIVDMTQALNQPKAHDAYGSEMEGSIEDLFLGVAVISHLRDEFWENEGVKLLALLKSETCCSQRVTSLGWMNCSNMICASRRFMGAAAIRWPRTFAD